MNWLVLGLCEICCSCGCGLLMIVLLTRFGEWKRVFKAFFSNNEECSALSPYFGSRSAIAIGVFAVCLIVEASLLRMLIVYVWVIKDEKVPRALMLFTSAFVPFFYSSTMALTLVRVWRLKVRHMYYIVLKNSSWIKLINSSIEDSLSFWVKYKAVITSNRGMIAMLSAWPLCFAILGCILLNRVSFVRTIAAASMILMNLLSLSLIATLPQDTYLLRGELLRLVMFDMATALVSMTVGIVSDSMRESVAIGQPFHACLHLLQFIVTFVWIPHRYTLTETKNAMTRKFSEASTAAKLTAVLSDVETMADFMEFCCSQFCAENLLVLLEIKEFKQNMRAKLAKELKAAKSSPPATVLVPETSTTDTESTSDFYNAHNLLISQVVEDGIELGVEKEWTDWDLTVGMRLDKVGCRSSIVYGAGDMHSKALALCNKYVEWNAEFSVNVSYRSRSKVLTLVGKDAVTKVSPLALLFIFDEIALTVFGNLRDVLDHFLIKKHLTIEM